MLSCSSPPTSFSMLINSGSSCDSASPGGLFTRRQMIQRTCAGFGMLGLASLLGSRSVLAGPTMQIPHFAPRAKRVIFLFQNGGPSHLDTFDPKPKLKEMEGKQPEGRKSRGTGFMP